MDEEVKNTVAAALADKLRTQAADFGLETGDPDQIATNIVEDFAGYAEFRETGDWEEKEKYKWNFIQNRFKNEETEQIHNYLPDDFLKNHKDINNLCGSYRNNLFTGQDKSIKYKEKWDGHKKTNDQYLDAILEDDPINEKVSKADALILEIANKTNAQSIAVLLFYLYPENFSPYNYTSLNSAAKKWGIPKDSQLRKSGNNCYISWTNFINNIILPVFKDELKKLQSIENVPLGIPLDVQDFIYCLNQYLKKPIESKKSSHNNTGEGMCETFREILQKLRANKQLILTGAPGTGKTHLAKRLAAWMISGRPENELNKESIQKELDNLKKELEVKDNSTKSELALRFEFLQFHPGYDYSDFVEGLKPEITEDTGQIIFNRKAGVFMEFCGRTRLNNLLPAFDESYQKLQQIISAELNEHLVLETIRKMKFEIKLNSKGNLTVLFGNELANKASITKENLKLRYWNQKLSYISLNGYIDAVIQYMKDNCKLPEYKDEQKPQPPAYVMVIDEINRADLSRVFGELFYGLEEEYRNTKISTQYSYLKADDEPDFIIPENVYIIGTMNDIDRSVESLDFALRRRFAWHEITAEASEHIIDAIDIINNKDDIIKEAKQRMRNLNGALMTETGLGPEYQLGGAYFKKIEKYCEDRIPNWGALWKNHLEVILREYLRARKNAKEILGRLRDAYENPTDSKAAQENTTP